MNPASSILLIDDEDNLRRTLALILQRAGYRVTTAASAREALQALEAGAFDLAFLDLRMPEVDGLTLMPKLRQQCPGLPVLIITAHASLETAIEAVRQGARDYLIKPVDPEQLLARVQQVLAERQNPIRRREIVSQIQGLLSQLDDIDDSSPEAARPTSQPAARYLYCGTMRLDLHTRRVQSGEKEAGLAPTTFDYLVCLVRHAPNPVSYETLVLEAQRYSVSRSEARELSRWQIHELRKALEPDPRHPQLIVTVRDVGYQLAGQLEYQ